MEPDFLNQIKKQIEKGTEIKKYATFALVMLMVIYMGNYGLGNPIGNALEPTQIEKTCEEINGICSNELCPSGYTEKENSCPNQEYCCKKVKQ